MTCCALVEDLANHGAEFVIVTEQFDTSTPMGQAMLTIVGALAQMESAQKSERATEWHRHRRVSGAVPAGPAALGYRSRGPNELEAGSGGRAARATTAAQSPTGRVWCCSAVRRSARQE